MRLTGFVPPLVLVLALASAGPAAAQSAYSLTLSRDTEVRVTTRAIPQTRVVGRVYGSPPDSLLVLPRGASAPVGYAIPELLTLEVRGGEDRRRGVLIGSGIGGGIALLFGGIDASRGEMSGGELASAAVGNALIGGLLGYAFAPKGWERLPLPVSR